jgi:hypothetical protein
MKFTKQDFWYYTFAGLMWFVCCMSLFLFLIWGQFIEMDIIPAMQTNQVTLLNILGFVVPPGCFILAVVMSFLVDDLDRTRQEKCDVQGM